MNILLIIGLVIFICFILWVYILFVANTVNEPETYEAVTDNIDYDNALEQCKKLFAEEKYQEVQKLAQKALTKNYSDIEIRRILAQALMKLNEEQMAIMHYEAILSVAPFDVSTQELLANYYLENGIKNKAIELFEQILMYDSGNVHAVETLASLYNSVQDYEKAVKMYEMLIDAELNEDKAKELQYTLADLYVKIQADGKAYDTYKKLYQSDSENLELLLILADLAAKNKYWKDALYYYNKVLSIVGDDFEILEKIAQAQTTLEQWSDVIVTYEKIISLEDEKSSNYFYHQNELCNALLKEGRCKEAIEKLKKLLIENPTETAFAFTLAGAYAMTGNYQLGVDLYKKLVDELPPEQGGMIINFISNLVASWGQDLFDKGDYTQAFDKFFEALKYNEENENVYYKLGVCNFYIKSFQDAIANFKKAISIKPENPEYYYALGCVYDEMGAIKNAKENFYSALSINPMFVKAKIAYAISMTKELEYAQSIPQFIDVLKLIPDNADTVYNLALAYELTGDIESAIENYKKALSIDPEHKEALNNIRLLLGDDYMPENVPITASQQDVPDDYADENTNNLKQLPNMSVTKVQEAAQEPNQEPAQESAENLEDFDFDFGENMNTDSNSNSMFS